MELSGAKAKGDVRKLGVLTPLERCRKLRVWNVQFVINVTNQRVILSYFKRTVCTTWNKALSYCLHYFSRWNVNETI